MPDGLLSSAFGLLNSDKPKTFRQLVEEKKKELKINSDNELSQMVGIPYNTLTRLIDAGNQKADLFSILKISQFLGIDQDSMIKVYTASLKPEAVGEIDVAEKANYILRNFNLQVLKKIKFIKNTTDFAEIDKRITKFFGIDSIYLYSQDVVPPAVFSKLKKYSNDEMRMMWCIAAIAQFEKLNNPNSYDREKLLALIPKIRPYTRNEETGLLVVIRALYRIGVTVIIQKYLANTSVRGATFIVNGKPCIVITDFKQSYSTLWFTLMHELYHVLFDLEELKAWSFHLSGEYDISNDLFKEDMANSFAHERLFPKIKLDYIRPMIQSAATVSDYAEKNKVHPGIVYSFYCYDEKVRNAKDTYAFYQHYFGKAEQAIKMIKLNPFDQETVYDGLDIVQTVYEYSSDNLKQNTQWPLPTKETEDSPKKKSLNN